MQMDVQNGRSKRKRQAFAVGDLRTCVCGETASPQSDTAANAIPGPGTLQTNGNYGMQVKMGKLLLT